MNLKIVRPTTTAQKTTGTTLDTIEVTPNLMRSWKIPEFQRSLRVNDKVTLLAEQIKRDGGVIPGVLTIGVLDKDRYLIDGQHRREAFLMSECIVGYADVRICHFEDMAAMGEEFVNLNSRLVNMRPDDILRGLERTYAPLAKIRKRCAFVGYGQIRRSERTPMLSMSAMLRCWFGSAPEAPMRGIGSAMSLVRALSSEDADLCIEFLNCAFAAWGRDENVNRLWCNLNLGLCMWLYRRIVLSAYSAKTKKISKEQFTRCLMSLAADPAYCDWLVGRNTSQRDVSPAYTRIKAIFARRLEQDLGGKHLLPKPAWEGSR